MIRLGVLNAKWTPQVRDVAGRLESIESEQGSYPKAVPAEPFPGQADGR